MFKNTEFQCHQALAPNLLGRTQMSNKWHRVLPQPAPRKISIFHWKDRPQIHKKQNKTKRTLNNKQATEKTDM
jgi:hypothetical protein